MALAASGITCRATAHLAIRRPLLFCVPKVGGSRCIAPIESAILREEKGSGSSAASDGKRDTSGNPHWKKMSASDLGIKTSMLSKPTSIVLRKLKSKGYDVYLVGGCVRDLLLKRTPKDFDVITTAELTEVRKTFSGCQIVGRRFPICHVYINGTIIEVSSFSTSPNQRRMKSYLKRPPGCKGDDYVRWRDCVRRDFTINGLMFDPFAEIIYDYTGGMEDIRKEKVQTITPASTSFEEDCARILRAIRIAARLDFRFSKDTALAVKDLSSSLLRLDKGRILLEMNYMLAYGSAEPSLRLLWRFGLLEILMPIQASYLASQGFKRRDTGSNMLLAMFARLDKFLAPDRPCHSSLWVAILALHMALVDKHRHPLVVAAFAITLYNEGSLNEAVDITRGISRKHELGFLELEASQVLDSKFMVMDEVIDLAASVRSAVFRMTDRQCVSRAMSEYPQAPQSDLVFIPEVLAEKVWEIIECVKTGREEESMHDSRTLAEIDYASLASGSLEDVRRVFSQIVFNTVFPSRQRKKFSNRD